MKPTRLRSQHGVLTRRGFLQIAAWVVVAAILKPLPAYASFLSSAGGTGQNTASGVTDLVIREQKMNIAGRDATATTINGSLPGPLLRFREGETATIRVTNTLRETTSIHWHGVLVPYDMDDVPGLSFPGIKPGETFTYRFKLRQSGTYWYHSHSGMQEQTGVYGPLLIESAEIESAEREVLP